MKQKYINFIIIVSPCFIHGISDIFICLYYFALNKTDPSVHVVSPRNSSSTICQLVVVFSEKNVENSTIRLQRPWVQLRSPVPARCCHPTVHGWGSVGGRGRQVPVWHSCTPAKDWGVQILTAGVQPEQPGTTMTVINLVGKVNEFWLPWISLWVFVHCLCFNTVCCDERTDPPASNTL